MEIIEIKQFLPADDSWYAEYKMDTEPNSYDKVLFWVSLIAQEQGMEYPAIMGFIACEEGLMPAEDVVNFNGYIQREGG